MKRALLLAVAGVVALACVLPFVQANSKVTPDHTNTSTDAVTTQAEIDRILGLATHVNKVETSRKEATPTPILLPSPTPEFVALAQEASTPANIVSDDPSPKSVGSDTLPEGAQTIEGAWITFFDCDVEGYCLVTASGVTLQERGDEEKERYAACDPNYWTLANPAKGIEGTKMRVVGDPHEYIWTCIDTGSAVLGPAHWDVWFYEQARGQKYLQEIGGDTVTIQILP